MKKYFLYSLVLFSVFQQNSFAQSKTSRKAILYFQNAEKEYEEQRYRYAIPFYKASLRTPGKHDSLASLHLAEAYWYVRHYDSALYYYRLYEHHYMSQLLTRKRIAELSASKKQYGEAARICQQLLEKSAGPERSFFAARKKGFSDPGAFLKDSLDYTVRLLKLNTAQQDFSPQLYGRGIVFASNRYSQTRTEKEFGWDGLPYAAIYRVRDTADLYTTDSIPGYDAERNSQLIRSNDDYTRFTSNDNDVIMLSGARTHFNGTIHRLEKFSDRLNSKYNYGPLCFNRAGDTVYFTRNKLKADKRSYNLEICMATLRKGLWSQVTVLPFVQNGYDYYHPALSADGSRLYFCSNQPGGYGGSDIYYVLLGPDDRMSVPMSLDHRINTAGNELFPTLRGDTLLFSSDGHPGLGGLDVYRVWLQKSSWTIPQNIGYPINTSFDDFGMIFYPGSSKGLFTSNRLGTDDIFLFGHQPFAVQLQGTVLSRLTNRRLDSVTVVARSLDAHPEWADSLVTDLTGNYSFRLKPAASYVITCKRNGYLQDSVRMERVPAEPILPTAPVLLTPVPVVTDTAKHTTVAQANKGNQPLPPQPDIQSRIDALAKMIFFKTASAELTAAAITPLRELCDYLKKYPNLSLSIEGHTDNKAPAAYNRNLSLRRSNSVKTFFVKKGFSAGRFFTAGFGLEQPVASNDTEEGRAKNRRVVIKAIFQ